jgi:hypothetical protein
MSCYDVEFEFKEHPVSVECVKANGDTAIFNCRVCGRQRYFASPCTPDDCESRFKDFCEGKESKVDWYD